MRVTGLDSFRDCLGSRYSSHLGPLIPKSPSTPLLKLCPQARSPALDAPADRNQMGQDLDRGLPASRAVRSKCLLINAPTLAPELRPCPKPFSAALQSTPNFTAAHLFCVCRGVVALLPGCWAQQMGVILTEQRPPEALGQAASQPSSPGDLVQELRPCLPAAWCAKGLTPGTCSLSPLHHRPGHFWSPAYHGEDLGSQKCGLRLTRLSPLP